MLLALTTNQLYYAIGAGVLGLFLYGVVRAWRVFKGRRRLYENWDIEDSQLGQDGKTWAPGPGAKWNFVCLGNGTAIQDFWMPPDGSVGTNLRTWNPNTESWDIAWAVNNAPGFAHIQAEEDDARHVGGDDEEIRQPGGQEEGTRFLTGAWWPGSGRPGARS